MGDLTPRAQQALALSKRVAIELKANSVGSEHLLIGIIQLGQGVAVNALLRLGVDLVTIRSEVEEESKKKNSDKTAKGENDVCRIVKNCKGRTKGSKQKTTRQSTAFP